MTETTPVTRPLTPEEVDKMILHLKNGSTAEREIKVVRIQRASNGKRALVQTKDRTFMMNVPLSADIERLLGDRKQAFVVLGIDVQTGVKHVGSEVAGVSW